LEVVGLKDKTAVILTPRLLRRKWAAGWRTPRNPFSCSSRRESAHFSSLERTHVRCYGWTNTQEIRQHLAAFCDGENLPAIGDKVVLQVDACAATPSSATTRSRICCTGRCTRSRARKLRRKVHSSARNKLTFDFNSAPLTPQQVADVEKLVNERILENAGVSWTEVPHADIKSRKDVMQFFGEKYGDTVRVLQIGGSGAS